MNQWEPWKLQQLPHRNPLDGGELALLPFISAPDSTGRTYPFGISWAGTDDFPGTLFQSLWLNADQLSETIDNTGIYKLMYETLFDTEIPDQGARNVTNASNGQ